MVTAIGDLHGDIKQAKAGLRLLGLLDENLNWVGKNALLIQIGDVVDRGGASLSTIDLMEKIRRQARWEGGDVIQLMGNHELLNLQGDYRYVSKLELQDMGRKQRQAGSRGSILGDYLLGLQKWKVGMARGEYYGNVLRSRQMAIIAGYDKCRSLFIHAGAFTWMIDAVKNKYNGTGPIGPQTYIDAWNQALKAATDGCIDRECPADKKIKNTPFQEALLGSQGPLTSRYYGNTDEITLCKDVENVLFALRVIRIVVGHNVQGDGRIRQRCHGKVILIDVGIAHELGGHMAGFMCQNNTAIAKYPEREQILSGTN